ncbi:MAG: hypothetical protein ACPGTU_06880 [Myxococcota bacterium]
MSKKDLRRRPAMEEPTEEVTLFDLLNERDRHTPADFIDAVHRGDIDTLHRLALLLCRGEPANA